MDGKSIAYIAGIMLMATFWTEIRCVEVPACVVKQTKDHSLMANCSNVLGGLSIEIPRNLNPEIEEMIISNLFLNATEISNDLFKNYEKLRRLEISSIEAGDGYSNMVFYEDAFSKLKMLEKLSLSFFKLDKNPDYSWPPSLNRLELISVELKQLVNTKSLTNLEYLDLSDNSLEQFPKLDEKAYKLEAIYLKGNPIAMITVEQVAPYCLLTVLDLTLSKDANFTKTGLDFCPCLRLLNWLKKKVPSGDGIKLECGSVGSGANAIQLGNSKCPSNTTNFTEKELKLYSDCSAIQPGSSLWELLLYAVLFSVLFPIGYFANEAYNRYIAPSEEPAHVSHDSSKRPKRRLGGTLCKDSFECEFDCEEDCMETEQDETLNGDVILP